ncbi:hypothetical protein HK104_006399 [Borealophlyctis nickersoniae]|nr:hypothetical protein HK104_006399 [Borealophlyctis nickersoniae]
MDTSKFSSFKIDNIPFYTNRKKGNHILDHLMETCPKDKFVVASVHSYLHKDGKNRVYSKYAQVTKEEFASLLEKDNQIFEVMHEDTPQKVAFDCEKMTDSMDPFNQIKEKILEKFPDAVMNIPGSRTLQSDKRTKYSYHIILQNYVANGIDNLCGVKEWCTLPEQKALGFDQSIYRRKGLLKCINQSKGDKDLDGNPRTQDYIEGSQDVFDHTLFYNIQQDANKVAMPTTAAPRSKK